MRRLLLVVALVAATVMAAPSDSAHSAADLGYGATGWRVRQLQRDLNEHASVVCWWWKPCLAQYRVSVDGRFGPDTREAVKMFQAGQGIRPDGIVGPVTRARLRSPVEPCEVARAALVQGGASAYEVTLGVKISKRETGCRLLHVYRSSTSDNTYGAFGVNYFGRLMASRTKSLGHPSENMTWPGSVRIFLKLARESGWCHWDGPNYCAG